MRPLAINRTNDAVFKTIFANEKHKDITLSLINAVFEFEGTGQIQDITFLDRELDAEEEFGKESRLDLLGQSMDGTKVNIEVQVNRAEEMGRRSLYYWSRLYNDLKRGDVYTELKRTVAINILDFSLFPIARYPDFHSCYGIYNQKTGHQLSQDMEIHFLELPKWKLKNIKEMKRLEKWLAYFSKATTPEELEAIAMTEPMIQKALTNEVLFTTDQIVRRSYEKAEKYRRDYAAHMQYATKEGIRQGLEQGLAQGIEKGIEKGIEQGAEGTALEMLHDKMDINLISKYTKLSPERLNELGKLHNLL